MVITQTSRFLTWDDFEVVHTSRKVCFTSQDVVCNGIRRNETRVTLVPHVIHNASCPSGLAVLPLL